MKKILMILVIVTYSVFYANAQSDSAKSTPAASKGKTIHVDVTENQNSVYVGTILILHQDGSFLYGNNAKFNSYTEDGHWNYAIPKGNIITRGTYYIDSNDIIHFTRDNGYEDKGSFSYDENGKVVVLYKDKTLREDDR